jgi:hypothetical protein
MKNFKVFKCFDLQGSIEIDRMVELEMNSGEEVLEFIYKDCLKDDEEWLEYMNNWIGEDWNIKEQVEGDLEGNIFNVMVAEEINYLVLRNYKGGVSEEEIEELFYGLVGG